MSEQSKQEMGAAPAEPEFAAWVAIDWADKKHYWSLQVAGSNQIERGELDNTPEAVEVWMAELQLRFGDESRRGTHECARHVARTRLRSRIGRACCRHLLKRTVLELTAKS